MIIGFVGTPGSGKSYEAVKKILDNIHLGRKIYTNIEGLDDPMCREYIKGFCNITDFQLEVCLNHLTEEQARYFWHHCEPGSLILIDECHKHFSNRDWQTEKNKQFAEWASTHRHDGYDVVLITQDIEKIDKHARSLIEFTYLFRKINMFGSAMQRFYLVHSYAGDDHYGQPLSTAKRKYDKAIFPAYKSFNSEQFQEVAFMTHVNILKHPVFIAIPIVFGIAIYFGSKSGLLRGQIMPEANATEIHAESPLSDDTPPLPSPGEQVTQDQASLHQDQPTEDHLSEIRLYRTPDGQYIFTNNRYQPSGSRFIKTM